MSWDPSRAHQDVGATGRYNSSSALAQEYAALETDTSSRVDDEAGYRAIAKDNPPKNAAEYKALVDKWTKAGFKVRAIDMDGGDFTHSNIAVAPDDGSAGTSAPEPKTMDPSERLQTARDRVKEYEEEKWSGKSAEKMFAPSVDPQGFLEKYKVNFAKNQETAGNKSFKVPE